MGTRKERRSSKDGAVTPKDGTFGSVLQGNSGDSLGHTLELSSFGDMMTRAFILSHLSVIS